MLIEVETHPVFARIQTIKHLHVFMEHHVFAVWDFMSLLKFLQNTLAPSTWPWIPPLHGNLVRLINEIVLGEECDLLPPSSDNASPPRCPPSYASHFDLYLRAMEEAGADTRPILTFIKRLKKDGLAAALTEPSVPEASRLFMKDTFALLESREPHRVAAAFAFGRENAIPRMFHSLLEKFGISAEGAPIFHYYLQRHMELDGEEHGPAALRLVTTLCEGKPVKAEEAQASARHALLSRRQLWENISGLL
ncbi:MAG: heme oxygenase [Verrucomicrobia bacterium]|nr:MAG: heme oxygenase [Verrucomicrobiota bacterium]